MVSLHYCLTGQQQTGTTIKYAAVTGSDTMVRGGVSNNVQTKIEVITAMKVSFIFYYLFFIY